MSNLTKRNQLSREWDPFSLTRNFFGLEPFRFQIERPTATSFVPQFEVKETETAFVLSADLPGVKQEDIEVSLDKNRLTISGTRTAEERKEGESYHLYERSYGAFSRSFSVPENVDGEAIVAKLDNGVLRLELPKVAKAKPRKIAIK